MFSITNQVMDVNIVYYVLIFESVSIGSISLLINYVEPYLPIFISRGFRFGKCSSKTHHALLAKLEISKK